VNGKWERIEERKRISRGRRRVRKGKLMCHHQTERAPPPQPPPQKKEAATKLVNKIDNSVDPRSDS